jgi:hypothetical protein
VSVQLCFYVVWRRGCYSGLHDGACRKLGEAVLVHVVARGDRVVAVRGDAGVVVAVVQDRALIAQGGAVPAAVDTVKSWQGAAVATRTHANAKKKRAARARDL